MTRPDIDRILDRDGADRTDIHDLARYAMELELEVSEKHADGIALEREVDGFERNPCYCPTCVAVRAR